MLLAGLVVDGERLLEYRLHDIARDGRGERREVRDVLEDGLERVERAPSISLRVSDEQVNRLVREAYLSLLPSPLEFRADRPLEHRADVSVGERLQHEHPTPGEQRLRQLETRVLRGGADQRDDPVLDPGEKGVLLALVEAVDLVAEENRPAALVAAPLLGFLDDLPHPPHAFGHSRERLEVAVGVVRDEARQRGLAGAGRAPENAGAHIAAADQVAERLPRPEQVLLAQELLEGPGPHPRRQRLAGAPEQRRLSHTRSSNTFVK